MDQGLPRSTVKHLADAGIAAEHVGDIGMARGSDDAILETARRQNAIVVSLDADFHKALATSHATSPSAVRIRIEGLKGDQLAAVVMQVIANANSDLSIGALVSVTASRIRVRKVPIS